MRYDQGDGPAAFAIFIVGIVIMGAALWVHFTFQPPWWVHVILWVPATFGLTIICLRIIKSILVKQQFLHLPPEAPSPPAQP